MKEPKEYTLVTVADIIDALTPENIDNFMIDFKSFVESVHNICKIASVIDPDIKGKKPSEIGQAVFNWIDDGKHDATGGIKITNPDTGEEIELPLDVDLVNKIANSIK